LVNSSTIGLSHNTTQPYANPSNIRWLTCLSLIFLSDWKPKAKILDKYKNSKGNISKGFEKLETKNYSHPEVLKEDLVSNLSSFDSLS
jgi:hypothetical protein